MTRRFAMGPWLYALAALLGMVSAWLSVVTYVALIVFLHYLLQLFIYFILRVRIITNIPPCTE